MHITKEEYIAYQNGTLSNLRKNEIEEYLNANPLEKKALSGYMQQNDTVQFESSLQSLQTRLNQRIENSSTEKVGTTRSIRKKRIRYLQIISAVAASLLLLMLFSPWETTLIELQDYEQVYPDVLTNIVRGDNVMASTEKIASAMQAYKNGDFSNADAQLTQIMAEEPENDNLAFYQAISRYYIGDYSSALLTFDRLSSADESYAYADGALWYKALTLLRLDQSTEAKEALLQISNMDHYKSSDAAYLLEHFDEIQ